MMSEHGAHDTIRLLLAIASVMIIACGPRTTPPVDNVNAAAIAECIAIPVPAGCSPRSLLRRPCVTLRRGEHRRETFKRECFDEQPSIEAWTQVLRQRGFATQRSTRGLQTQHGDVVILRFRNDEIAGDVVATPDGDDLCWEYRFRFQRFRDHGRPQRWQVPIDAPFFLDKAHGVKRLFDVDPSFPSEPDDRPGFLSPN